MSFTKNLNKLLLIGTVLVGNSMNGNCASSPIDHIVSPRILSTNSIKELPIKTQNTLFLTTLDSLSDSTFTQTFVESLSTKERSVFFSKITTAYLNILTQVPKFGEQIMVYTQPTHSDERSLTDTIYDEEGWFLDDDLRHAQEEMSLLIDFAHRSAPINPILEKVLNNLNNYYEDEGKSKEFIECAQFVINGIKKLDFSLFSSENSERLQQLQKRLENK